MRCKCFTLNLKTAYENNDSELRELTESNEKFLNALCTLLVNRQNRPKFIAFSFVTSSDNILRFQ